MTTSIQLLENFDKTIVPKQEEIAKIQKQIQGTKSRLLTKLKKHFIETDELLNLENLKECLEPVSLKKLLVAVLTNRSLRDDEIIPENLFYLERLDEKQTTTVNEGIKNTFDSLSEEKQYYLAFFCYGYIVMFKKFDFMRDFLFEKLGLQEYGEESLIKDSGYNQDTKQAVLCISMKKDDLTGAKLLANAVFPLIEKGIYKPNFIDVFEHTCSQHDCYTIQLEDVNGVITPVFTGRYSSKFTSQKETLIEQLADCFEYIAKYHPYSIPEEECEEEDIW